MRIEMRMEMKMRMRMRMRDEDEDEERVASHAEGVDMWVRGAGVGVGGLEGDGAGRMAVFLYCRVRHCEVKARSAQAHLFLLDNVVWS